MQILGQTDIDPAPRGTILFWSPVAFFYLWFVVDTVCVCASTPTVAIW